MRSRKEVHKWRKMNSRQVMEREIILHTRGAQIFRSINARLKYIHVAISENSA